MGKLYCVFVLLLIHTRTGLAQDVITNPGVNISDEPNNKTSNPSDVFEQNVFDTRIRISDQQNFTRTPITEFEGIVSASQQIKAVVISNASNTDELKLNLQDKVNSFAVNETFEKKSEQDYTFQNKIEITKISSDQAFKNSSKVSDIEDTKQSTHTNASISRETIPDRGLISTHSVVEEDSIRKPIASNVAARNIDHPEASISANSTSPETLTLPKIKWKPGMKQPQTIADLVRITGADIEFIVSQFGGEEKGNASTNVLKRKGTPVSKGKASPVKIVDNPIDVSVTDESDKTIKGNQKGNVQNDSFIDSKDLNSKLSSTNIEHLESNSTGVLSPVPMGSNLANGLIQNRKFNTREPVRTIVKQSVSKLIPSRHNIVLKSPVRKPIFNKASILSGHNFRGNGESFLPVTTQEIVPGSASKQSETDSRGSLISFGNNPQYTIGTENSVKIPKVITHDRLANIDSIKQSDNFLPRTLSSGSELLKVPPETEHIISSGGFILGTTSPLSRDTSRVESSGSSWAQLGSNEAVTSGFVSSSSLPILNEVDATGSRRGMPERQGFQRTMTFGGGDGLGGSLSPPSGSHSVVTDGSFYASPFVRRPEALASVGDTLRENSMIDSRFGGMIPREPRLRNDFSTRNGASTEFPRQPRFEGFSFGRSIPVPIEMERSSVTGHSFYNPTRDFTDMVSPYALAARNFGLSVSVPLGYSTLTPDVFGRRRFPSEFIGMPSSVYPAGGVIDTVSRPTAMFRGNMFRPLIGHSAMYPARGF